MSQLCYFLRFWDVTIASLQFLESCTIAKLSPSLSKITGARNLRKDVLGTFLTSYKLKTMPTGALVREWPMGFSVWNEDESAPDGSGYRL